MSDQQTNSASAEVAGSPSPEGAAVAEPSPPMTPPAAVPAPSPAAPPYGKRYGFLCTYCSSRLEAVESMAGQGGTCPTCGNAIVIPILDARGRLIDPTSGQVIKQDPHPVHAYAAAGHKAPHIVTVNPSGEIAIQCPRCSRQNALAANNCVGCGLPFTMEGTSGDSVAGTNTWAVASFVLGIITLPGGFCLVMPPVLAIVFGMLALRSGNTTDGKTPGQGLAVAGIVLGMLGLIFAGLCWAHFPHY